MQQTMRWYGPNDGVTLKDILQAGCTGVVTALHHIPVGEIWTDKEIKIRKAVIEAEGLQWTVVESLPVHEDIKRRDGNFTEWIENYKISLKNLGSNGIKVITYNFMPVLDWLRTDLNYKTKSGALALRFEWIAFISFDLYILQRPGAEKDYKAEDIQKAKDYFSSLSQQEKENLASACMQGLPGSTEHFSATKILALLQEFKDINEQKLQTHLFSFLNEIAPICEQFGLQMAIHPDDPPFPILGLPRIMSKAEHIRSMLVAVPFSCIGLCFCTGSYGARKENDLKSMIQEFGSKIYFLHLRSTQRDLEGNFFEANHLEGNADLIRIIQEVVQLENNQKRSIPMRPDHGHQLLIDNQVKSFPGYSFVGRLKGLAEIRGVEQAIRQLSK